MAHDSGLQPSAEVSRLSSSVAAIAASRAEIGATLVIDSLLIIVATIVRWASLWVFHQLASPDAGLTIRALELVLNVGPVGTTVVLTVFDLGKRVKTGWHDLRGAP